MNVLLYIKDISANQIDFNFNGLKNKKIAEPYTGLVTLHIYGKTFSKLCLFYF